MSALSDTEVLRVLSLCDEYCRRRTALDAAMSSGFFQLSRARKSSGSGTKSFSVEDCREEFEAMTMLDDSLVVRDDDVPVDTSSLVANVSSSSAAVSAISTVSDESSSALGWECIDQNMSLNFDHGDEAEALRQSLMMMSALPPPALRSAQKNFVAALKEAIALCAIERQIRAVTQTHNVTVHSNDVTSQTHDDKDIEDEITAPNNAELRKRNAASK